MRFFAGDINAVPQHCLTQGLATIMAARHIVLIATGRAKADAVHQLVEVRSARCGQRRSSSTTPM
jgi:glucosamine-6-phosphate deaminase